MSCDICATECTNLTRCVNCKHAFELGERAEQGRWQRFLRRVLWVFKDVKMNGSHYTNAIKMLNDAEKNGVK